MLAVLKLVLLTFAVGGVAATGAVAAVVHMPLENAKLNKETQLGPDSTMPEQSRDGLQNAYDRICDNQERWLANHNATKVPDADDGDDEDLA